MFRVLSHRFSGVLTLLGLALAVSCGGPETTNQAYIDKPAPDQATGSAENIQNAPNTPSSFGSLPITFEPNQGQTNSQVKFLTKVNGYNLYLTETEMVFDVVVREPSIDEALLIAPDAIITQPGESAAVKFSLLGANPNSTAEGVNKQSGVSNYLIGNDPSKWVTDIEQYAEVLVTGVYEGINLRFYGAGNVVEHDFIVAANADPSLIKMQVVGAKMLYIAEDGDLEVVLNEEGTKLTVKKPFAYQNNKSNQIEAAYRLIDATTVGFTVGTYDVSQELVIDPVTLVYSGYLGGTSDDITWGIDVDSSGNVYTVGYTKSTNFPVVGGLSSPNNALQGNFDAFVTKVNAAGSSLTYSTYLGGTADDLANSIKVDSSGNVYVTGYTTSGDFPVTATVPSAPLSKTRLGATGDYDAFVTKLNSTGSTLTYSYYLGGSAFDRGAQIALDTSSTSCTTGGLACMVVVGTTASTITMTVGGAQTSFGGGAADAFVMRLVSAGTSVTASTYIGGDGRDIGNGIALDTNAGAPNVYIVGEKRAGSTGAFLSSSSTAAPFRSCLTSGGADIQDAFIVKLPNTLASRTYSGCYGGDNRDGTAGIGLDIVSGGCATAGSACAVVTGTTSSGNSSFPSTNPFTGHSDNAGGKDIYIAKFNSGATAFTYMTYMGGVQDDQALGFQSIFVDSNGEAWVTGQTASSAFPTYNASQSSLTTATSNAFVLKIAGGTTAVDLSFSTYLGGTTSGKNDVGVGIVVDSAATNAYVTGVAESTTGFPTSGSGWTNSTANQGGKDGFLAKFTTPPITVVNSATVIGSTAGTSIVIAKPTNTADGDIMLAAIVLNDDAAAINNVPTGWTQLANIQQAGGHATNDDGRLYVYWKLAASEGTNYTWGVDTSVKHVGGIIAFRNVNPTSPIHLNNSQATASATTHDTQSLAVTEYNSMIVTFHAMTEGNTWTPPTGMAEQFDIRSGTAANNDEGLGGSYVLQASPGATGAKQATADEAGFGMTAIISLSER